MRRPSLLGFLFVALTLNACGSSGTSSGTGGKSGGTGGTSGGVGGTSGGTGGTSGGVGGTSGGTGGSSGGTGGLAGGVGGTDGGSPGVGGGDGGLAACGNDNQMTSGETCHSASATGPCVMQQISSATPPAAAGGTIVAGTYNLTSMTFYGPADSGNSQQSDRRSTFVISSVTAASFKLDQVDASGARLERSSGTVAITGTMVTYTPICPPPGDGGDNGGSASFTATATTFSLIESKNGGTEVSVYTKI
jgi:hypothetical protein